MTPLERARQVADRLAVGAEDLLPIGRGTGHLAFAVGSYVVRLVADIEAPTATSLTREAALLEHLETRLPVAVPSPCLVAADLGAIAYRRLPGQPLLDVQLTDTSRLVDDLGAFLHALAGVDDAVTGDLVAPDPYPLDAWRDEVAVDVLRHGDALTATERRAIHAFARAAPPSEPSELVFCHGDLGAEHLLVDVASGGLVGVLDWSDAALTDPCRDLGRLTRDLGPTAVERMVSIAELDARLLDRRRIGFHARLATLEDLAYGLGAGDGRYVDAARRAFPSLFAPLA